MNYFEVKLYNGEPLLISPDEAEGVKRAISSQSKFVQVKGEIIGVGNIAGVTETGERIADGFILIGEKPSQSPIVNSDGSVQAIWCKKTVSPREWSSYYKNHPSYHRLDSGSSDIAVGFTRVVSGESLPGHIEICTDKEMRYLSERF